MERNADAGSSYMPQPHGGAMANSGVSVQGYLVVTADELIVPTGRAVPAGFARRDGKFLYYHLQSNGHIGGTQTSTDPSPPRTNGTPPTSRVSCRQ